MTTVKVKTEKDMLSYYYCMYTGSAEVMKHSYLTFCIIVRMLREELQLLQEQGSYVGEVVKPMDKKKVLVKVGFFLECYFRQAF